MKPSRFAAARRLLAALLTLALVVELVPTTALAQMTRLDDEAVRQLVEPLALVDESVDGPAQALAQAADRLLDEAGDEAGEADVVKLAFATLAHAQALARLEADATASTPDEEAAAEEVVAEELDTTPAEEATDPATAATTPAEVTANEVQDALSGKLASDDALVHALALLLRTVGIDAIEVSWPADETHDQARTWLLVHVDGTWYHVDLATTMAEVTSELGDIEFAKTVEDVQWKARLGENCAWLLASDDEMRAGNEDRGAWVPAKGELEALNLTELPACPDAYVWPIEQAKADDSVAEDLVVEDANEDAEAEGLLVAAEAEPADSVEPVDTAEPVAEDETSPDVAEAEVKPEEDNKIEGNDTEVNEVVADPEETNAKPDDEEATQEEAKIEGSETNQDAVIVEEATAEEGEDPDALATEADPEQPTDAEDQLPAEEDGPEISGELPALEEGSPEDDAPEDAAPAADAPEDAAPEADVIDRTVSSVTSRRLSAPRPEVTQEEDATPEPTDAVENADESDAAAADADEAQADADVAAEGAQEPIEPADAEATGEDLEDLEIVGTTEIQLHLYQNGWIPSEEEHEGLELEAMASTLTARQREALKARFVRACENLNSSIDISDLNISTNVSYDTLDAAISDVVNSNPDLFWVRDYVGVSWSSTKYVEVRPVYWEGLVNSGNLATMRANYEASLKDVLSWVPLTSGYYDQCKAVHDWLVKVCVYTQDVADGKDWINTHSGFEKYRPYTAYGALVVHDAVCNGYALAFLAAMNRLGIPCVFVSSGAINHAWNLVQINGYWYHIDCTWDDPVGNRGYWGGATPTTWFMKSDSYMLNTYNYSGVRHHSWSPSTYACNDSTYDYWSWYWWDGGWSRSTPTGYSLPSSISMTTDAQRKLTISNLTPSNAPLTDATWSSSNSVVSVSSIGVVSSGKSAGIATVTCNIWGVKRSTTVYVYGGSLSSSGITATLSPKSYNYNGKAKKPSVKVTHKTSTGTLTLRSGTDYSVSYSNNTGPGTATVTITGKGSYSGSLKKTFIIYGDISTATVSGVSNKTYTGSARTQSPTVKVAGKTLKKGTDYTLSYKNNTKVGTATMTITGKGAYKGTKKVSFKIYQIDISKATVSGVSNKTYRGKAVTQSPTVKVNGKTLKKGTDYTISYKNNNKVGTATMIITGKGAYKGTKKVTFKIVQNVPKWQRYGGKTALDTARIVVEADNAFKAGRGGVAILATNSGYWDALAASALAGLYDAPVLITNGKSLSSQTRAELQRLKVENVIIVGGKAAVSTTVAWDVYYMNIGVYRVAGKNAVGTANAIFSEWNGYWSKTAIVATSTGYWDALAIAPYAFKAKAPIFLTGSGNKLTSDTVSAIRSGNFNRVVIVGGKAAVSGSVESQLKGAGVSSVVRLSGKTALDTSAEIAKWEIKQGMGVSHLTLATSNGYWDALTGAAVCGKLNSVLVLVSSGGDTRAFRAVYDKNKVTHGHILGGNAAVPASVERYVKSR